MKKTIGEQIHHAVFNLLEENPDWTTKQIVGFMERSDYNANTVRRITGNVRAALLRPSPNLSESRKETLITTWKNESYGLKRTFKNKKTVQTYTFDGTETIPHQILVTAERMRRPWSIAYLLLDQQGESLGWTNGTVRVTYKNRNGERWDVVERDDILASRVGSKKNVGEIEARILTVMISDGLNK